MELLDFGTLNMVIIPERIVSANGSYLATNKAMKLNS